MNGLLVAVSSQQSELLVGEDRLEECKEEVRTNDVVVHDDDDVLLLGSVLFVCHTACAKYVVADSAVTPAIFTHLHVVETIPINVVISVTTK